jgi:ubiquitin-activating enzyme E1 C
MSENAGQELQDHDDVIDVNIKKWHSILPLFTRQSPFVPPGYEEGLEGLDLINNSSRILVVGAGGLGCEILKNLALSGFSDIHVIDLDTIDVSNLNRQFLFRLADCNNYKAKVAADFIMKRCRGVKVTPHTKPIQEFQAKWYSQFDCVIAGLDNIEARQWLNETLVNLVGYDEQGNIVPDTIIPLIDGGTEGFGWLIDFSHH